MGAILSQTTRITDDMIYASGAALPELLTEEELAAGMLYPALDRIREVSQHVVLKVIRAAQQNKVDRVTSLRGMSDDDLKKWIEARMYDPFKV